MNSPGPTPSAPPATVAPVQFTFRDHAVRTVTVNGDPWFVSADVCQVLGIRNSRDALARLDADEKGVTTMNTNRGPQQLSTVNECGLYHLIFHSRKPEARAFRRWVTQEVLPAIRRTGRYETQRQDRSHPDSGTRVPVQFTFRDHAVRTVTVNGDPWFVAADACEVLALNNSRQALARLDEDEKGLTTIDGSQGPREMAVVTESGLYRLIFSSRKPKARAFRRWVMQEVLPTIRKTGRYETQREDRSRADDGTPAPVTVALDGPGRYSVTVLEDGQHYSFPLDPMTLIADDIQATAEMLCHLVMTIDATWRKLQVLFSGTGSLQDDLFMKSHAEAVRHAGRTAAHYIRIFDSERSRDVPRANGDGDGHSGRKKSFGVQRADRRRDHRDQG
jgi:prophage antirepressor-like protein